MTRFGEKSDSGRLCRYLILHWIDTVVHQTGAKVTYGYILVSTFFSVFKILSDVFVFWGIWKVLFRFAHLDTRFEHRKGSPLDLGQRYESARYIKTNLVGILLIFFSVYHICLSFALTFAWLQAVDPLVIQLIARAKNAFEISYMTIQFLGTGAMFLWLPDLERDEQYYKEYHRSMRFAIVGLGVRSFCEIVIVGQLDRWPDHLAEIMRARDVTYSLFSIIMTPCIISSIPNFLADVNVEKEEKEVKEVKQWVLQKLERDSQSGTVTAPDLNGVLEELEELEGQLKLKLALKDGAFHQSRRAQSAEAQLLEVERIRAMYGEWTPICKI